jgi:hypothetical protein
MAQYAQYAPQAAQALMASSPQWGQLAGLQGQLLSAGQTPNAQLAGMEQNVLGQIPGQMQTFQNLAGQAATQLNPINQQLQAMSGQVQAGTNQAVAQLGQYQNTLLQNARSDIFNATKGNVLGALGNLDPLTQQLQTTAQQQLALGGGMSSQMQADVAQQERAAFQARGMLQSTGSIGAEVMGTQQAQQALLQQREQFAGAVSPIVQQEQQQRTANALGLTATDIQATQANYGLAGQLAQWAGGLGQSGAQIQAGLQGQIGSNLQNAIAAQSGLQGQALSAYQTGIGQASGLQQSILQEQLAQQGLGANIGQYITGAQQNAAMGIIGAPTAAAGLMQQATGMNAYGTGGPGIFQGLGVFPATVQNQAMGYNANMYAQAANAQSQGSATGAMIGAGGAIVGGLVGGLAIF